MKLVYINYLAYLCTSIVRESINNINKKCTVDRTKTHYDKERNFKNVL